MNYKYSKILFLTLIVILIEILALLQLSTSGKELNINDDNRGLISQDNNDVIEVDYNNGENDQNNDNEYTLDPLSISQNLPVTAEITLDMDFISQAPYGDWGMPYQEACEEASLVMVEYYLRNANLSLVIADEEILGLVEFEKNQNYAVDTTVEETGKIAKKYYNRNYYVYYGQQVTIENIKKLISQGYPVIVPLYGNVLGNPHYNYPPPSYHMFVIIGYNEENFITHDPGTRYGAGYEYAYETIDKAIHNWAGSKETVSEGERAMLVVGK